MILDAHSLLYHHGSATLLNDRINVCGAKPVIH